MEVQLTRREGWEQILLRYLDEAETRPFEWGAHDCALWVASFVDEVTGSQLAAIWEGRYRTQRGALGLMKRRGFETVADIADAHLQPIPLPFAGRGDVLLHPQGTLGLCSGRSGHFLSDGGPDVIPALSCLRAWKV